MLLMCMTTHGYRGPQILVHRRDKTGLSHMHTHPEILQRILSLPTQGKVMSTKVMSVNVS